MVRTGRPTDDPKHLVFQVRLSKEMKEKLDFCCDTTGRTRAEIIREGIDRTYQFLLEQKDAKK